MAVVHESSGSQIVLLYTTATEVRPTYRRGVLDCLSYPEGHVLEFSYRAGQIHTDLRGDAAVAPGASGVVIFIDEAPGPKYIYCPLRRVRVLSGLPAAAKGDKISERERIPIFLELRDFVEYKYPPEPTQWHSKVLPFDNIRNIRGSKPEFFVTRASDVFTAASVSPLAAWEEIVTSVAKSHVLANAVFLSVECPEEFDRRCRLTLINKNQAPQYLIRPGEVYRLNLAVYDQTQRETKLKLTSSSDDLVQVNQPFQSVVSGLAQKSALIACKRTIEKRLVALSIEVVEDTSAGKTAVNSPNPIILLRIGVAWWVLPTFLSSVAVGAFLVSCDPDLIKSLWSTPSFKLFGLLAKGIGAAVLALAAWVGFRKLPSADH